MCVFLTLRCYQVDELITVLANDHRPMKRSITTNGKNSNNLPKVAGNVVPLDTVSIFVIKDGQASLVVELLEALDGDANVVVSLDGPFLDALVVVRLRDAALSGGGPEGVGSRLRGK